MKKVLITGSSGFIGRALCAELAEHGYEVVEFDKANSSDQNVLSRIGLNFVMAVAKPDVVVHLAAEVGKLNCEVDSNIAMDVNVMGTKNVAEACVRHGARFIYASTSEVYGDHGDDAIDEDTVENTAYLSGTYAISKLSGEFMAWRYGPTGNTIICRPAMPYGPGVPPGPGRRALDNLVYQALTGKPMVVHRGASRSWCWIGDVASAFRYVIEHGSGGSIYNVGRDDDEVLMRDLAMKILPLCVGHDEAVSSWPEMIEFVDAPSHQTLVKRISCARLGHLGWAPETGLDVGLPIMVGWMREWIDTHECKLSD